MSDVFEITHDETGISEIAYRPSIGGGSEKGDQLLFELMAGFPECLLPPYPSVTTWKVIGKTQANGINYFEDTIAVSIDGETPDALLTYLSIPLTAKHSRSTGYTLKFGLTSRTVIVKEYVLDDTTPRPALPPHCFTNGELGVHLNHPDLANVRDFYFYTTVDDAAIAAWFDHPVPPVVGGEKYIGLLYELPTLAVKKMKVYVYPQHGARQELHYDTNTATLYRQ